jgi:RimJ/RimL family protein N-acetyltransferase
MNIKGKTVLLRAIETGDLPSLNEWSNDPDIWYMLGGWHFPFSMQDTTSWYEAITPNDQKNQIFAIEVEGTGIVGTANLVNIDWKNKNAFHGMMLGKHNLRGKGVALDTVMAVMRYAFDELGLNRLDGDMIDYNQRSIEFYINKCGWEVEGRKKDWYFRKGEYHDKVVVGITRQRYQEHIKNTAYWDDKAAD